jgi:hypothetical protein
MSRRDDQRPPAGPVARGRQQADQQRQQVAEQPQSRQLAGRPQTDATIADK